MYEFNVEMMCEGCANAVTNVLNKKEGMIHYIFINLFNIYI